MNAISVTSERTYRRPSVEKEIETGGPGEYERLGSTNFKSLRDARIGDLEAVVLIRNQFNGLIQSASLLANEYRGRFQIEGAEHDKRIQEHFDEIVRTAKEAFPHIDVIQPAVASRVPSQRSIWRRLFGG